MATKKETTAQDNLRYYEMLRKVPQEALKTIGAGRLKGMSDINPVFRIKTMTEAFGPCGIGWKYEITKQWQETFGQEVKSFTNINLYVKVGDEWSDAIPGTGGATLVEINSKGYAYVNDEGHKMSLTDALSVAMKSLGVAADVYYAKDVKNFDTKYDQQAYVAQQPIQQSAQRPATAAQMAQYRFTAMDASVNAAFGKSTTNEHLMAIWNAASPELQANQAFRDAYTKRSNEIKGGKK